MGDYSTSVVISITGTPGTGKSTICSKLSEKGYSVVSTKQLAKMNECLGNYDPEYDSYPIDMDRLSEISDLSKYDFVDGHLSHFLASNAVVVLRCKPEILKQRLEKRGYSEQKIRSNLEWEYISGISSEMRQDPRPLIEINTTSTKINDVVAMIIQFHDNLKNGEKEFPSEIIDWMNNPPNF